MSNFDNPRWTEQEDIFLRENFNKSYGELANELKRSVRSLKHRVGTLGLKRDERKAWSEEELSILKANSNLSPKDFVEKGLLQRSKFQIAKGLRECRGTANRCLRSGWNAPSKELAYLLGSWCSDGSCGNGFVMWCQKRENRVFLEEVMRCWKSVVDTPISNDFSKGLTYEHVWSCGKNILDIFCVDGCVAKPSWGVLIQKKYGWILSDDGFFWAFIGGLYDGDGSLSMGFRASTKDGLWSSVTLGVKDELSRRLIVDEMLKRGFEWMRSTQDELGVVESIILCGGESEKERFLSLVSCVIGYKKQRTGFGMEKISREQANEFLLGAHYLKDSLRPGTVSYGGFKNGVLCGVISFGSPVSPIEQERLLGKEDMNKVWELARFATVDEGKNFGSSLLAQGLKLIAEEKGVWLVLSYADTKVGHVGTLYKATNAYYLGLTGSAKMKFVYVVARGEEREIAKERFMARNRSRIVSWKEGN